jgi:flagellar FliL protein
MATAAKPPAKQEAAPAAAVEAPAPKRSSKLLLIIVLIVLLVLIIAVVGIGALVLLKKSGGSHGDDGHAEPARIEAPALVASATVDLDHPPIFASLDPFTVNLRAENGDDDRYLQAVIALRVPDQKTADALKGFMPEIRHRINMTMSAKMPGDVQTIKGREALASEIQIQLNTLLGFPPPPPDSTFQPLSQGPIQAVLFNSFIVQ